MVVRTFLTSLPILTLAVTVDVVLTGVIQGDSRTNFIYYSRGRPSQSETDDVHRNRHEFDLKGKGLQTIFHEDFNNTDIIRDSVTLLSNRTHFLVHSSSSDAESGSTDLFGDCIRECTKTGSHHSTKRDSSVQRSRSMVTEFHECNRKCLADPTYYLPDHDDVHNDDETDDGSTDQHSSDDHQSVDRDRQLSHLEQLQQMMADRDHIIGK